MSMTYENMKIQFLPAGVVCKDFIKGIESYSYEDYLIEFVNQSDFFLAKSEGDRFIHPGEESHGECDCVSDAYQMDFKLAASKTKLQSKRLFSSQIHVGNGWTSYGGPQKEPGSKGYKPIKATFLHVALRSLRQNDLDAISKSNVKQSGIENDLRHFVQCLQVNKNLFLFFPYNFFFDENNDFDLGLMLAVQGLNQDFCESMIYRQKECPEKDTFFAFLYAQHLVILEWRGEQLVYIEKIPIQRSPLFMKLLNYSDEFDNRTLK